MKISRLVGVASVLLAGIVLARNLMIHYEKPANGWKQLVQTKGQYYPVPAEWLKTPEDRITHDLVLPPGVPAPVPFDFDKADGYWFWPKSNWEVSKAYFRHLCRTEAGEWIFEKQTDVEGLYFARPLTRPTTAYMNNLFAVEAPFVEGEFYILGDYLEPSGGIFLHTPFVNYAYVEQPRRDVTWQAGIDEPYIRLFGYSARWELWKDTYVRRLKELTPIQLRGIDSPQSRYALTWRGISRPLDREYRIAGGELIVYERASKKVIAISRTYQLGRRSKSNLQVASWFQSPACRQGISPAGMFLTEFTRRVLEEKPVIVNSQDKGTYLWRFQPSKNYMNSR